MAQGPLPSLNAADTVDGWERQFWETDGWEVHGWYADLDVEVLTAESVKNWQDVLIEHGDVPEFFLIEKG